MQVFGAVLILTAFALVQFRVLSASSLAYLLLNLVGAGALAGSAFYESQWGFFVLNGVWTLVSAVSVALRTRRTRAADV